MERIDHITLTEKGTMLKCVGNKIEIVHWILDVKPCDVTNNGFKENDIIFGPLF